MGYTDIKLQVLEVVDVVGDGKGRTDGEEHIRWHYGVENVLDRWREDEGRYLDI